MKLTLATLAKLKMPEGKTDYIVFDDAMPGFGVRIRAGADREHRTYIMQCKIGDKQRRINLGNVSKVTLDSAREHAKIIFGDVARGLDPVAESVAKIELTLGAIVARYLEAKQPAMRERTYQNASYQLKTLFAPLHGLPVTSINRAAVATELSRIAAANGAVTCNRARSTLSAMFAWAIGEGIAETNPVVGTNKREENDPRKRTLSDSEAASLLLALRDDRFGNVARLLLLTGCRRDEIGSLRWSEVDLNARVITLPSERTKNGRQHIVPLSEAALRILQSMPRREGFDFVFAAGGNGFQSWTQPKLVVDEKLKFSAPWTLHDLRRTVRTGLGKLGVSPHVAEAVLNHLPPKLIRTYDRNAYETEKRDALERWASHLAVAIAQASGSNVVKLGKTSQ